MSKIVRYPPSAPAPYSKAVRAGDFLFLSGQIAFGPDGIVVHGGIEVQTKVVLDTITRNLEELGCALSDIVKMTVWLQDVRDFRGYNEVFSKYFAKDPPARSTVRADLMRDARIEIEAVAYKPSKR
jgi:2-iminobutanoate/2-iminopropanoate deaminase